MRSKASEAPRRQGGALIDRRAAQWPLRLAGGLFGLGAGAVGLFSLLGAPAFAALERERALGFGVAALVVGAVALFGSLATRDVRALWYCSPRRWRAFRADVLDGSAARRPLRPEDDASASR